MHKLNFTEKEILSFDGTKIAYQTIGEGPVIFLTNGHGGNIIAWTHIIQWFQDRYRFVSFDFRGQYHSDTPKDRRNLSIPAHVKDILAILESENISEAIFAGWSMGVQVNFELYRVYPEVFRGLLVVSGTYGKPFETAFQSPVSPFLLPLILEGGKAVAPLVHHLVNCLHDKDVVIDLASKIGAVNRNVDRQVFRQLAAEFGRFDFWTYFEVLRLLGEHDASDVLERVAVPTLIIHGEWDRMTPPSVCDEMLKKIPNSEIFTVPSGTHYSILEFPEIVNFRLEPWLKAFGDKSVPPPSAAGKSKARASMQRKNGGPKAG